MKCEVCRAPLQENQVGNFQGKVLCEDCCFDLMNPPKVCDPLAVSSTLSVRKQLGQTGTDGLTDLQKQIYRINESAENGSSRDGTPICYPAALRIATHVQRGRHNLSY